MCALYTHTYTYTYAIYCVIYVCIYLYVQMRPMFVICDIYIGICIRAYM